MADDWKYAVEDFDDADDGSSNQANGTGSAADGQATDVFGEAGATDVEPGSPRPENVAFVCLGIAIALLVILVV